MPSRIVFGRKGPNWPLSTAVTPSPWPCGDFENLAALAAPDSIIAIHDCPPWMLFENAECRDSVPRRRCEFSGYLRRCGGTRPRFVRKLNALDTALSKTSCGISFAGRPSVPSGQHRTVARHYQGREMRAIGGAVKLTARCSAKSHRICQIRPSTKPIAIATEISNTINSTKVIGMFLSADAP